MSTNDEAKRVWEKRLDEFDRKVWARGDEYRGLVAMVVTPAVLGEYDDCFRRSAGVGFPGCWVDYWWGVLRDLCPNKVYHASLAKFQATCRTCGAALISVACDC